MKKSFLELFSYKDKLKLKKFYKFHCYTYASDAINNQRKGSTYNVITTNIIKRRIDLCIIWSLGFCQQNHCKEISEN